MKNIGLLGYHEAAENILHFLQQEENISIQGAYTDFALDNELYHGMGVNIFNNLNDMLENVDSVIMLGRDENMLRTIERVIKFKRDIYVHDLRSFQLDYLRYLSTVATEAGIKSTINIDLGFHNVVETLLLYLNQPQMIDIDLNGFLQGDIEDPINDIQLMNICFLTSLLSDNPIKKIQVQLITVSENNSEALSIRIEYHNNCIINLLSDSLDQSKQQIKVYQKQSLIVADLLQKNVSIHHHKEKPKLKIKGAENKEVSIEKPMVNQSSFNAIKHFLSPEKSKSDLQNVYQILKISAGIKEKLSLSEILMQ